MLNSGQLQHLILKILRSELSAPELNLYIRYCASLTTAFLFSRRSVGKLGHEFLSADEARIQQLAIDLIAELFARDDQNRFTQLIKYYEPLASQIEASPDEALFSTRRLMVSHAKQSLTKTYAQNDPAGARIYRNLGLVPKRDEAVKLNSYGDHQYFYYWNKPNLCSFPDDLNPCKSQIDWDSAIRMLQTSHKDIGSFPGIVREFLVELAKEMDFRHFIEKSELFKLLNHIMGMKTVSFEQDNYPSDHDLSNNAAISESDQTRCLELVNAIIHSEIEAKYVSKSKISSDESTIYSDILTRYFSDLIMDGFAGKLPEYQAASLYHDLAPDMWKMHRGRLEYLIKLGREQLKIQFQHEFLKWPKMSIEGR